MRHNTRTRVIALTVSVAVLIESCVSPLSAATVWQERAQRAKPSSPQIAWALPLSPLPLSWRSPASAKTVGAVPQSSALDQAIAAVPPSRGRVSRVDARPGRPVIVHLLDVHGNDEAQKNLSNLVSELTARGGAKAVALEGAFGSLDLGGFARYPHHRALTTAADYSLGLHEISGPIHSLLLSDHPMPAVGVDSPALYRRNTTAVRNADANRPAARASLSQWRAELNVALSALNPQLSSVEAAIDAHRAGGISLGDHLSVLMRHGVVAPDVLTRFIQVLAMERALDTQRAEAQRAELIRVLVPRLSHAQIAELTQASLGLRSGQVSAPAFYDGLLSACRASGVSPERFPAFLFYVRYALAADALNGAEVLSAATAYEAKVEDTLARTSTERNTVAETRFYRLADGLVTFSLTPSDWRSLKTVLGSPCRLARSDTGDFHASLHARGLSADPFLEFYRAAERRDADMAARAVSIAEKYGVAVLVTGGFHADGIAAALKKAAISVVRVEPTLSAVERQDGFEALSAFTRQRTPLEHLVHGQRLFLAPPPAGGLPSLGLYADAVAIRDGAPAQAAYDALPLARPGVSVDGRRNGNTVTQTVKDGGNRAFITYLFDAKGGLLRHVVQLNPAPEIVTFIALALTVGTGNAALLAIPAALGLRFILIASQFLVHEFAHGVTRWITDGGRLSDIRESFVAFTPWSLLPFFPSALTPRLSTGDATPWKIRLKAAAGPLANLAVAVVAAGTVLFWSSSLSVLAVSTLSAIAIVNVLLLSMSWTDFLSIVRGTAPFGFFCGVFGIAARRTDTDAGLLPARMERKLRAMGAHTQVRGRQAGGGVILGKTSGGRGAFIGGKLVNPKRGNLTDIVFRQLRRLVSRAAWAGVSARETFVALFHWRFGTSSAPSVVETHWHEWVPPQQKKIWAVNEGVAGARVDSFNIRIVHNGDFDGIEANPRLSVFGKKLDVGDVGLALSRLLWPNSTKGDSPKIAGMMTLLATQGMWDASVRLAYLLEIEPDLRTAFSGLRGPKEIAARVKQLSDPLEEIFTQQASSLFVPGATSLRQVDRAKIPAFLATAEAALVRRVPLASAWPAEKRKAFIETALYAFLMNDVEHAVQMFMAIPQKTSTFGLGVVSTLEPEKVVLAAQGQPLSVTRSKSEGLHAFASEPAAAIAAVENRDAELMDLDDDGGEIAVVTASNISVFSLSKRRALTADEIEKRWIPIDDNPYITRPDMPREGEDLVKRDLDEVAPTLSSIHDDFQSDQSWNRETANRFADTLIQRAKENGNRRPEEFDLLLIGEEKSAETTQRFAHDLLQIYPTMKIMTITGNDYLKNRKKLFANKLIGSGTVVLAVSQSGQTFPTLKATRHAEKTREAVAGAVDGAFTEDTEEVTATEDLEAAHQRGQLRDVFVLTGEWYSKMGKTMGQGFHPDDRFGGRIFCNMSGRRRSEASTVAMLATDFLLTKILTHTARRMREAFPNGQPFNMTLKKSDIDRVEAESQFFLDVSLPSLTGTDRYGRRLKSNVNESLVASGKKWSVLLLENLTVTLLIVGLVWVLVAFNLMPSGLVELTANWALSFTGWETTATDILATRIAGLSLSSVLNASFFATLPWSITGALRFSQKRDLWARTGARHITITSPIAKTLRNYVKRLFGESLGHFQPQVNAAKAEDLVNYESASVARGGLLFVQIEDDRPMTESQEQEIAATKMAASQAWGIQNFGSGLEILGTKFDPDAPYKIETIPLRTALEHRAKGRPDDRPDEVHELLTTRYRHAEMMAAGFVFFHAMAEEAAQFNVELYKRRTHWAIEWVIYGPAQALSWVLSRSFKTFYSFVNRVVLGGSRMIRLFTPGATQSGTAIATTQMTPDRSQSGLSDGLVVDEAQAARFRGAGSSRGPWSPSGRESHISWFLAHIFADAGVPIAAAEPEPVPQSKPFAGRTDRPIAPPAPAAKMAPAQKAASDPPVLPRAEENGSSIGTYFLIFILAAAMVGLAWLAKEFKVMDWLKTFWENTPIQGVGMLAALPLLGAFGLSGAANTTGGRPSDDAARYVLLLKELAAQVPGRETGDVAQMLNAILAGTAVSLGVESFGTPANASRARRRQAVAALVTSLESDADLRRRVSELLDKPTPETALQLVESALRGPDGAPTLADARAGWDLGDKPLTLIGLRGDLWMPLGTGDQEAVLRDMSGPIPAAGGVGTVIVADSEETAASVRDTALRLGRADIAVQVAPGLYSDEAGVTRFHVGALESAAAQVVRLDERSAIEVIASPSEPDLAGVSGESRLRSAVMRLIDASLRVVDQGTLMDVGLAAKAAALIAEQA